MAIGTAHGMARVHAASVLGGIAAAALITLPIPYLLGLIAGRPGLSASLMAVNQFLGAGIGAAHLRRPAPRSAAIPPPPPSPAPPASLGGAPHPRP